MMKPVYTAVLMDMEDGPNNLKTPLLIGCHPDQLQHQATCSPRRNGMLLSTANLFFKICHFVAGMGLGIAFSVIGFQVLLRTFHADLNNTQIVLFSLAWSSLTGITSYVCFALLWFGLMPILVHGGSGSANAQSALKLMEYYFALGVFLGFCAACTVTDILFGMPFHNILTTVVISIIWSILMMVCGSYETYEDEDNEEQDQVVYITVRKGTMLPLLVV